MYGKQRGHHTSNQSYRSGNQNNNNRMKDVLQNAPRGLSIPTYVEKRISEITRLAESTSSNTGYRLTAQLVPLHMRRRAMSHNVKRLPRRLHQLATKDFELEGKVPPTKRPSRKHRRRPKNLLAEYERRKRKHIWLETHIWHAKRFKMEEKWGYKIAVRPRDKSFRALYRASVNYCMMQDISYMCCIELLGQERVLLDGLSHMTNTDAGLTFAAKACLSGNKEGHVTLFLKDQYPSGVIGRVSFMWRPIDGSEVGTSSDSEGSRRLWIWCHPAFRMNVWKELLNVFEIPDSAVQQRFSCADEEKLHLKMQSDVTESGKDDDNGEPVCKKARLNHAYTETSKVSAGGVELSRGKDPIAVHGRPESAGGNDASREDDGKTRSLAVSKTVTGKVEAIETTSQGGLGYPSASSNNVTLNLLQDNLVRFSLTGSLSQSVLSDLFHKPSVKRISSSKSSWWSHYGSDESFTERLSKQWDFWNLHKTVQSPAQWPPNAIIGLTVRDPRVFLPQKRFRVSTDQQRTFTPSIAISSVPSFLSSSPLWDDYVRDAVSRDKLSDKAISDARSQLLVPGTELALGDRESRVPLILIQRPGKQPAMSRHATSQMPRHTSNLGYGSGWDVILPKGMARAFWVGLIYRGVRPGGVRDMDSVIREEQYLRIPNDYPDSAVAQAESLSHRRLLYDTYYRKPPAKRPNYCKLGTVAPFHSPWAELVRDWRKHQQSKLPTNNVTTSLDGNNKAVTDSDANYIVLRSKKALKILSKAIEPCPNGKTLNRKHGQESKCKSKVPQASAASLNIVMNPEMLDILKHYEHSIVPVSITMCRRGIPYDRAMICIPSKLDLEMYKSDQIFNGPKETLHIPISAEKCAKKKHSTQKKNRGEKCGGGKSFEEEIGKLLENVVDSADRGIIGYVTNGAFSYLACQGAGVGLCSVIGLMHWRSEFQAGVTPLVLVRSPSSVHYKFATISVIV